MGGDTVTWKHGNKESTKTRENRNLVVCMTQPTAHAQREAPQRGFPAHHLNRVLLGQNVAEAGGGRRDERVGQTGLPIAIAPAEEHSQGRHLVVKILAATS